MYRFQIELPDATGNAIEALMQVLGTQTKKDLFENALTLLSWAVRETQRGRIIASVDEENKRYAEVVLPVLQHAAMVAQVKTSVTGILEAATVQAPVRGVRSET